jgi:hypothetical protein
MKKKMTVFASLMIVFLLGLVVTSTSAVGSDNEYKPVPQTEDTVTAMLSTIGNKNGHLYVTVDPIEWYEGAAADKKFLEREPDAEDLGGAPDGYYIVNDDETLETYEIAPDAEVLMQLYDHDGTYEGMNIQWNEPVSLNKFLAIYHNDKLLDIRSFPFHLTVKDGKVVKVVQQYIP